jgi:hypothetical protein
MIPDFDRRVTTCMSMFLPARSIGSFGAALAAMIPVI